MLKNYFKIAWRNLTKNKVFSLINILGLTIGITCCMMIFLFITNEFSYDSFHKQGKNIYRVMRSFDSTRPAVPWLSGPYAPALLNDYNGVVKQAVRVMPTNELITFDDKSFHEKGIYLADPGFFNMFSFPLIKGDPSTALSDPNSVVLTESTAKRYFGDKDPMGKVIEAEKTHQLRVTGIAKDVPANSHLKFDLVHSITMYNNEDFFKKWINNNNVTYLLLDEHANKAQLEKSFPQFMERHMGTEMRAFGMNFSLSLVPLKDVYFLPGNSFDPNHGDKKVVYIFLSIAVLILLIGCINFMNLSTIRAVERSKEVGLRKVMGALRNHLVWQFIGESVLLTIISCVLSIGLLQLLMPLYNQLLGYTLSVSWNTPAIYLFLTGVILVVGCLAGSYPAIFLSAFSPIQALKGKLRLGKSGSFFRQALVVVQFSISVFLIIGTIIIMNQMSYVKNKELGYSKEQSILVPIYNSDLYEHHEAFKSELLTSNNVASVSSMCGEPGGFFDIHGFEAEGQPEKVRYRTEFADFDYVKSLGLKIIAGRDLSGRFATDTAGAVLINRTAAGLLGFTPEQAIGKWIKNAVRDKEPRHIVGVIEDFNFLSLKQKMEPLVIAPGNDFRVIVVKLKPGADISSSLATIKKVYAKVAPGFPFEYSFLDQKFDVMYKTDIRQQTILSIFAGLAIFVACLGLFGLASFTANKRVKEIGVRKVLGSSAKNIVLLLSKDLLKPVLLATVIAMPAGYYAMHNWLQNFAYRTELDWWIFVLAAVITIVIALTTVSIKAVKAAMANPTKSLRAE
ncbi:MAG: ABC transporter permease [Chitinophagaceae bacterium]